MWAKLFDLIFYLLNPGAMRGFGEKCNAVLSFLKENDVTDWDVFFIATGIKQKDPVLAYLKDKKGFIDYNSTEVIITQKGLDFIRKTSFTSTGNFNNR